MGSMPKKDEFPVPVTTALIGRLLAYPKKRLRFS